MREREPAYWITTHWPQLLHVDWRHPPNVYVKAEHRAECDIQPGDEVLVYEYRSGPPLVLPATGQTIEREEGRQGIIYAVKVIAGFQERPSGEAQQEYENRGPCNWKWKLPTEILADGFIPRKAMNVKLGWPAGYTLRGFHGGRGFKRIGSQDYTNLLSRLTRR